MNTDPGHITEFVDGLTGTCGETAGEEAEAAASGGHATEQGMVNLYNAMRAHNQADPNGASTLWALARQAERDGFEVALEWDYAEPFPHDWHQALLNYAGKNPIVVQLGNGQALNDVETGAHDEVGLKYHFVCIVNKQADGYVVNDGDNPEVTKRYQVYSYQTFLNADVCGLLVLAPKVGTVSTPVAPNVAENYTVVGNKYRDNRTGNLIGQGVYDWAVKEGIAEPVTIAEREIPNEGGDTVTGFGDALLAVWDATKLVVTTSWSAGTLRRFLAVVDAIPAPKPTPIPPEVKTVLAEVVNLLQPSATALNAVADVLKKLG